jgi:hypothetical protein
MMLAFGPARSVFKMNSGSSLYESLCAMRLRMWGQ